MKICWSDVSFPPPPQIHPLYNKRIKKWAKKTKQNQEKRKIEKKKIRKRVCQNVEKWQTDIARAGSPFCAHRQGLCLSSNHAPQKWSRGSSSQDDRLYTILVPTPSCESPL